MSIKSGFPQLPTPGQIGAEESIKDTTTKSAPADSDALVLADSSVAGKKKLWTFVRLKAWLETIFAAIKHGHEISDVAGLESTLSNKANAEWVKGLTQLPTVSGGAILDAIIERMAGGVYCGNFFAINSPDLPVKETNWGYNIAYFCGEYPVVIAYRSFGSAINSGLFCRMITRQGDGSHSWHGTWTPIATATPPQWYDLPLAEGWTAYAQATYGKDQFGRVHIDAEVSKSTALVAGETIATLPVGYRPNKVISTWGFSLCNSNTFVGVPLVIETTGVIHVSKSANLSNISAYVSHYTITIDRSFAGT